MTPAAGIGLIASGQLELADLAVRATGPPIADEPARVVKDIHPGRPMDDASRQGDHRRTQEGVGRDQVDDIIVPMLRFIFPAVLLVVKAPIALTFICSDI